MIDKTQFIRLILQSLYSLGFSKAASTLESESGIRLDSPEYSSLAAQALAGQWEGCIATVDSISGLDPDSRLTAQFLIWREHFLELLGSDEGLLSARDLLWRRISKLDLDRKWAHGLARVLIDMEGAVRVEERAKRRKGLLLELVSLMPDWIRAPPSGRLEQLLEMAVLKQLDSCFYHNLPKEDVCLYEDHRCSKEQLPCKSSQILHGHKNEVWFVQFSNSGSYLASSSRDCTTIIWTRGARKNSINAEIYMDTKLDLHHGGLGDFRHRQRKFQVNEDDTLSLKHSLEGHGKPISFVAWSPDDTMLLTCGNKEVLKLWDVDSGMCKLTFSSPTNCIIGSCAWFPDSNKIVCGSYEPHNRISTCDLEGNELEVWEGVRLPKVSDLAVTPDGNHLIICSNREIWIRDFSRGKEWAITEENSITSFSLSRDGRSCIVNLNSQEIHLWSILEGRTVPDKFTGHKQGNYVIRSCFGGSNCLFIASGSEDSQVYIWQRHQEKPIQVLSGHSMTVNSVSWNPIKPHMLASASDDRTVRIWVASKTPGKILS